MNGYSVRGRNSVKNICPLSEKGSTLKQRICSPRGQILPFQAIVKPSMVQMSLRSWEFVLDTGSSSH